ncbi:MAG: hypothetical protein QOD75_2063 [Blastocatellia bacterium]|jgi:orotate phosphoribosyltransferase|nr:hypothetical protein [Blastocatellia bacterium]
MLRDAQSTTLASLPENFHSARVELLELLRRDGILRRSANQPVLSRDGTSARWMLDSLAVTLSPRGAQLAGQCILELLKRFDGFQIATYGLTAVPILQSCLLLDNRYRGLLVRKERKQHGSLKLIEGVIDPAEPIVLIDDSVSSGTCMTEATERLEEAGLRVEGGICLVRFGWYGGYALMQERGYHMEAVYDIWDDFIAQMPDEEKPLANPSKWFPEFRWSPERAAEGLHPAELARQIVSHYLISGELLRPPEKLHAEYNSEGGAWVSIRSRSDLHQRFGRDGFWHFPGEQCGSAAEDVVMASLRTAVDLPAGDAGMQLLEQSAFAVTFFSALEHCHPGQLDNDRYGIVVRSLERRDKMGGALPRMPGIASEWQQFQHARMKNGQLVSFEPYELYRHDVVKVIEPEATWQPTGVPAPDTVPWHENPKVCGRIAERGRDLVLSELFGIPETTAELTDGAGISDLDSLYLTIYVNGHLRGCMGSVIGDLDEGLRTIAKSALHDDRFTADKTSDPQSVAVSVSFLFNPLELGELPAKEVVKYYRHGEQTLMVYRGEQVGLLLPFVATMWNLDAAAFADAVLEKAGLADPPYYWCRFDCVTWLAESDGVSATCGGFIKKHEQLRAEELIERNAALHTRYLLRHLKEDGTLYSRYQPFQDTVSEQVDLARLAHAAWVLARAGKSQGREEVIIAGSKVIDALLLKILPDGELIWQSDVGEVTSVAELAFLLLALSNLPEDDSRNAQVAPLAVTLWSSIDPLSGRISTHRKSGESSEAFQDYFPGQVLLALGVACEVEASQIDSEKLRRCFRYYRHRFRHNRHFGQVTWLMQACSKWWQVTGDLCFAEMAFEVGDWLLGYQQEKTGAFINDHQPETPGYTTAVYLEGIAAAVHVAAALNDETRYQAYRGSFLRGSMFLDRLVLQERDRSILPNPEWAVGGLRQGLHYSEVRIDFVQHALSASLEFTNL